jgi:hypothetical protein
MTGRLRAHGPETGIRLDPASSFNQRDGRVRTWVQRRAEPLPDEGPMDAAPTGDRPQPIGRD